MPVVLPSASGRLGTAVEVPLSPSPPLASVSWGRSSAPSDMVTGAYVIVGEKIGDIP